MALPGDPEELRWCVHFQEDMKPWVLNSTCAQVIANFTGCQETEGWTGKKIVLYNDPNVAFKGKITGGIRVRAPRGQAAQSTAVTAQPVKLAPQPTEPEPDEPF